MITNEMTTTATGPLFANQQLAAGDVVLTDNNRVVVSLGVQQVDCELAVLDYDPTPGDRVLVIGDLQSGHFVIGVLSTVGPRPKFTVDPSGATTLEVAQGDLQLSAPHGKIRLTSAAGVEAHSARVIELRSGTAVRFSVIDRLGQALSILGLTRTRTEVSNRSVHVTSEDLHIEATRSRVKSEDFGGELGSVNLTVSRMSVAIETLLSTVGNAYQKVTGLWQLAADRTRMIVRGTSHHKAKRIYSKAEDVKVKSNKIHLG